MANEFDVPVSVIGQTISFFLLGYGVGQFFGGPLSDQIGRKKIALIGLCIFMLATIGVIFSSSLFVMKIMRAAQGIGGGFATVIVMACMRDVYPAHEAGRKYSIAMMIMLIMPIIAPIIGAQLIPFGWRSIFVASFGLVLFAFFAYLLGIPETAHHMTKKVNLSLMFKQFRGVLGKRTDDGMRAIRYVFAVSFTVGLLLSFVTNSSQIYQGIFGVSEQMFPYFFGSNTILMILCITYSVRMMKKVHPHKLFLRGNLINLFFVWAMLIYVLFFEATLYPTTALIILSIGSMGLINPCASAVYISHFDELSGSATSFNRLLVLTSGGLVGSLVGHFSDGTLIPFAVTAFICSLGSNLIGWSMPRPSTPFRSK